MNSLADPIQGIGIAITSPYPQNSLICVPRVVIVVDYRRRAYRRFAFTLRSRSVTASRPPSSGHRHVRLAALVGCAADHCHMVAMRT